MGFIENILGDIGVKEVLEEQNYRITIVGEVASYIECVKSIKSYSKSEICLRLKKGGIIIKGEDLTIKKYCEGDMVICGKVMSIERV